MHCRGVLGWGIAVLLLSLGCSPTPEGIPDLEVSPLALDFRESASSLPLTIRNTGGGILEWEVRVSEVWVRIPLPKEGRTTDAETLVVRVERDRLPELSLIHI